MSPEQPAAGTRDLRIDFFRGLALVVIFVNHMPGNPWFHYTPSRLGPSDAAEAFVFLSGYVAARAYGGRFARAGLWKGSAAVLKRCVQLYAAHLALFAALLTLLAAATAAGGAGIGAELQALSYFFDHTPEAMLALVSLRYVPNLVDILPMYLLILLWLPVFWALSRLHVAVALAASVALYAGARLLGWELPADPAGDRPWYFNPFCWQLLFCTGFALGSRWIAVPRYRPALAWACAAFVVFCFPLEHALGYTNLPWFAALRESWSGALDKSHLGLVRYLHFLAVAWLLAAFCGSGGRWLRHPLARQMITLGQHSLPVFVIGTCLAFAGGLLLALAGAGLGGSALLNASGILLMIACAHLLTWFDRAPRNGMAGAGRNGPRLAGPP